MNRKDIAVTDSQAADYWWLFLLQGIAAIIIGWLLLTNTAKTTISLVVILGLYWLIAGVIDVVGALLDITTKGSRWGWRLLGGLIGIMAGLIIVNNPLFAGIVTPVIFMYIVAFIFIINGIIQMVVGNQSKVDGHHEWSWASFFLGAIYLLFGLVLLSSPTILSTASVIMAAAILAIVGGIGTIVLGFRIKGSGSDGK